MPIRNLSDRKRVPRLGKIHLGIKVQKEGGGAEYPKAVDYFVCPPEVQEVYGERPTELRVMFVSNDPDLAASQYFRSYKRTVGLVCRGDGYQATARLDVAAWERAKGQVVPGIWASAESKRSAMRTIECGGEGYGEAPACPAYAAGQCKRLMMLQFAVLGVRGLGVYQIDTSSVNGIQNINGFFEFLGTLTGGRIAGIPLLLRLVPQEVSPDGKKKTVHVLRLDAAFTMEQLVEAAQRPTVELLPPPADEEVPDDFFPAEVPDENAPLPGTDETAREAAGPPRPRLQAPSEAPAPIPGGEERPDPRAKASPAPAPWADPAWVPANAGQFLTAALSLGYKNAAQVWAALGVKGQLDVADWGEALRALRALRETETNDA